MSGSSHASVLLVEDNADHALLAKLAISRLDEVREVRVAADGVQALEILRRGPLPDLVLLDLRLPRLDGFAVLEALRREPRLRDLPVVVLSTSSTEDDRARSASLGVAGYLRKPVDVTVLRQIIRDRRDASRQQVLPL